jgi:hypothetical protein
MHDDRVEIAEEMGSKKTFVWVLDWPGWCRAGKASHLAIDSLIEHGPRYARVARLAGLEIGDVSPHDLVTIAAVPGGSGTDFGVPSAIIDDDRRPTTASDGERLAGLVAAAWRTLDDVAAAAPASLRKGPRGGGRDRDKIVHHALEADHAYAHEIGLRAPAPDPADRPAIEAERAAILAILAAPSDGSPLGGRRWPVRYAARRIAWHALDHAWEIEDRTEPDRDAQSDPSGTAVERT